MSVINQFNFVSENVMFRLQGESDEQHLLLKQFGSFKWDVILETLLQV